MVGNLKKSSIGKFIARSLLSKSRVYGFFTSVQISGDFRRWNSLHRGAFTLCRQFVRNRAPFDRSSPATLAFLFCSAEHSSTCASWLAAPLLCRAWKLTARRLAPVVAPLQGSAPCRRHHRCTPPSPPNPRPSAPPSSAARVPALSIALKHSHSLSTAPPSSLTPTPLSLFSICKSKRAAQFWRLQSQCTVHLQPWVTPKSGHPKRFSGQLSGG